MLSLLGQNPTPPPFFFTPLGVILLSSCILEFLHFFCLVPATPSEGGCGFLTPVYDEVLLAIVPLPLPIPV